MRTLSRALAAPALLLACSESPAPAAAEAPTNFIEGGWVPQPATPEIATRSAPRRVPVIAGGTLAVLRDDRTAAASDPDHDLVWLVDLTGARPPRRVALRAGDEPGRVVEDDVGGLHVALRGGRSVATLDPATGAVTARREVCAAPRGLAWDPGLAALHVACADGELVTLPRAGAPAATLRLARDLRDVAVHDGAVYVSRFREATVQRLAAVDGRLVDPGGETAGGAGDVVAWRMAAAPGGLVLLSQAVRSLTLGTGGGGGGGYDGSITPRAPSLAATVPMMPRVRVVASSGQGFDALVADAGLTVDVAAFDAGESWRVALASPGWAFRQGWPQVREWTLGRWAGQRVVRADEEAGRHPMPGQAVAVAYTRAGALLVQTRAPGRIVTPDRVIALYDDPVGDTGHDLFHASTTSGLACASCHPEGGEDGLTWSFLGAGLRRTPSLRGGILQTAPFHWSGNVATMGALCDTVYTARMGGARTTSVQSAALGRWLDALPTRPRVAPADGDAVARGEALFRDPAVACASCHSGPMRTNNQSADVGTGAAYQTPPLVDLARRAPYMHDGCAATLTARFTDARCGGGELHGHTAHLAPPQLADLVAYLESL